MQERYIALRSPEIDEDIEFDSDDSYLVVRYTIQETLSEDYDETSIDPEDFVYAINGTILLDEETEQGFIKCHYIEGDKIIRNGILLMDAFDSINDSLCGIGEHILTDVDSNELNEEIFNEEWMSRNFLYIDELYITPEYRGKNLGLIAIETTIRRFGEKCTAVILHACPLTIEPQRIPEEEAKSKLKKHYATLGFEQIGDTDYMLKNLCYA